MCSQDNESEELTFFAREWSEEMRPLSPAVSPASRSNASSSPIRTRSSGVRSERSMSAASSSVLTPQTRSFATRLNTCSRHPMCPSSVMKMESGCLHVRVCSSSQVHTSLDAVLSVVRARI